MSQRLRQRGYDETLIDQAVENAYKRYSILLLNLTPKDSDSRVILCLNTLETFRM